MPRRMQATRMNYEAMLFMLAVVLSALLLFSMVFYVRAARVGGTGRNEGEGAG